MQSKFSYTNKDYESIYSNLMQLSRELSSKWSPSNEADPGVVMVKLMSYLGDALSYNEDKNFQEMIPSTVSQTKNARAVFEPIGYKMKWYQSARVQAQVSNNYVVKNYKEIIITNIEESGEGDSKIFTTTITLGSKDTDKFLLASGKVVTLKDSKVTISASSSDLSVNPSYVVSGTDSVTSESVTDSAFSRINDEEFSLDDKVFKFRLSDIDVGYDYDSHKIYIKEGVTKFITSDNKFLWFYVVNSDDSSHYDAIYPTYDSGAQGAYGSIKEAGHRNSVELTLYESPISPSYLGKESVGNKTTIGVIHNNISENTIKCSDSTWIANSDEFSNTGLGYSLKQDDHDNPYIELYVKSNNPPNFYAEYLLSSGQIDISVGEELSIKGIHNGLGSDSSEIADTNLSNSIKAIVLSISNYGNDPETPDEARNNIWSSINQSDILITTDDYNNLIRRLQTLIIDSSCTDSQNDIVYTETDTGKVRLDYATYDGTNYKFNTSNTLGSSILVNAVATDFYKNYYTISPFQDVESGSDILESIDEATKSHRAIPCKIANTQGTIPVINFGEMSLSLIVSSKDSTMTVDKYKAVLCEELMRNAEFGKIYTESDILSILQEYDPNLVSLGVTLIYNYTFDNYDNPDYLQYHKNNIVKLMTYNHLPTHTTYYPSLLSGDPTKDNVDGLNLIGVPLLSPELRAKFSQSISAKNRTTWMELLYKKEGVLKTTTSAPEDNKSPYWFDGMIKSNLIGVDSSDPNAPKTAANTTELYTALGYSDTGVSQLQDKVGNQLAIYTLIKKSGVSFIKTQETSDEYDSTAKKEDGYPKYYKDNNVTYENVYAYSRYDHEVDPFDYSDIRNPINKITIPRIKVSDIKITMNSNKWVK